MPLHPVIAKVTDRIIERSRTARGTYLGRMAEAAAEGPRRAHLTCGNQAHAYAAMSDDKGALAAVRAPNLGIVTAYNDMLSAHQPFETYPDQIRTAARSVGATAQVARCAGDVRRGDPRPGGHGVVAVFTRCDRAGRRRGPVAQYL